MNLRRLAPVDRGAPAAPIRSLMISSSSAAVFVGLSTLFPLSYLLRCIGSCARKAASPAGVMR
jgi:hypothetical protein